MNNSPVWAIVSLYLACHACPSPTFGDELGQPLVSAFYTEDADCSGLLSRAWAPEISAPSRLPYAYRWNDYQGADIEHNIYGDRGRHFRASGHVHLCPAAARRFGGLFAVPGPECGMTLRSAASPEAGQPPHCGCEQHQAALAPVPPPEPPTVVAPVPVEPTPAETTTEPTPAETTLVPPRIVAPEPMPPQTTIPPITQRESPSPDSKPAPAARPQPTRIEPAVPQTQLPSVPATISDRLVPIQISPAAPPAGLPIQPKVRRDGLRRNEIPASPAKGPAEGTQSSGELREFFNDLLLGPRN